MDAFLTPMRMMVKPLESMSPTDDRFLEASASTDQVHPVSPEDRAKVELLRVGLNETWNEKRFSDAQQITDVVKAEQIALDKKDKEFNLVRRCALDAEACMKMELALDNCLLAGEWCVLKDSLDLRLVEYHDAQAKKIEDDAKEAIEARSAKRSRVVSSLI
jgi:hypothetical protein